MPPGQASLTPNPKLFELNRQSIAKNVARKRKDAQRQGENFAGLQTYIISEIDSGSDNAGMAGPQNAGFLSDASSFTNSSESEREDCQNIVLAHGRHAKVANDQNSSESEGSEGENQDVVFGAELGNVPARARDHK